MKHHIVSWAKGMVLVAGCATFVSASAADDASVPAVKALTMMAASVPCADLDRCVAFYTKGLGMTLAGKVEMGATIEAPVHFPGGGAYILLQHPKSAETPLPTRGPLSRIAMLVPDLKALGAQLEAAGYPLTGKINEMPQYKVAVAMIHDPDGNSIELIQRMQ